MKNYITINQKGFSNFKDIDLVDATIFRYIFDFAMSNNTQKLLIDNELYFWVSYQKIIDDNPLIGISNKRVIERRIKKLLDNELLKKYIDKKVGNKVYFNITQLAYDVIIDNKEYVPKSTKVCTEQDKGVCTEQDKGVWTEGYNNRELINRELNIEEKKDFPSKNNEPTNKQEKRKAIVDLIRFLKKEDPGVARYETKYLTVLSGLIEMYSLEEVKGVLRYMYEDSFWKGKLFKPDSIKNNYSTVRQAYFKKKEGENNENNKIILC